MTLPFEKLTIEQVAHFPGPGTSVPARIEFTPDGSGVTYLLSEEGSLVRSLWRYDIATGARSVLVGPPPESTSEAGLSRDEELRRERARLRELGVTDYQFAKSSPAPVLLVPAGGRLYVRAGAGPLEEVPGGEGAVDPRLSDDGSRLAFVRAGELCVVYLASGEARQLTRSAEDGVTNGLAEFIAQEELDRSRGFWWSPQGTHIAYVNADERHIPVYPIVHQGKDAVDIEQHRYPFAGERNAAVQLHVVAVDGAETTRMDLGPDDDIYLARVAWRPDGVLTAQLLSRDQRTLRLVAFDSSGRATALIEEHGETWLNLDDDTRFLECGEMLRSSERTGFRHLYLHSRDGALIRPLTTGDWVVTRLVSVDEATRVAFFSGTRDSVLERHLYAVSLDGGDVRRITESPGWHGAVVSPDGARYVDVYSSLACPPQVTLRRIDGTKEAILFENEATSAAALGLLPPQLVEVKAADGSTLHAALYRPPSNKSGRPHPLIVSVYGGPHAQRVADEWSLTVDLRAQYLAQQGFLVLKLDNRGSANRGLAFEAWLAGHTGPIEIDDQVAGVRHLVDLGLADPGRVGIYGWSYGGYITLMAMLRAPEVFKVGVAGAPVTHWDGYDTAYTERYMRTPESNPGGYSDSSVLAHLDRLVGKLLIVHGMVDENVHFRHTARLMVALAAAQKEYDLLVFPEERHMPRDAKGLAYQERRVIDHFVAYL